MVDRLGPFDGFSLHLKICGGIAVGRGDTGVAKPLTNRKDIDPRSQQMYRGAMAHAVGVEACCSPMRVSPKMWSTRFFDESGRPDFSPSATLPGRSAVHSLLCFRSSHFERARSDEAAVE